MNSKYIFWITIIGIFIKKWPIILLIFSKRSDTHMTYILTRLVWIRKNEMLSNVGGEQGGAETGVSKCSGCPIFIIFIKENWIGTMTRHAESNINTLMTRNLIDSDIRRWNHPLMLPMHCLWAKRNNRMRDQFEYDITWFCFFVLFWLLLFTCTVRLLFHSCVGEGWREGFV